MQQGPPRRRRARPVADAPVDALLRRTEDLTKGWLLALLEAAPLDEAPAILASDLAREGPRVCEAIVRALADDHDLRRIEPGGTFEGLVSRVGELAGAPAPDSTSRAVDGLQAVIWSALRAELPAPDAELVSQLAERLAVITELVRGAALRRAGIMHTTTVREADAPAAAAVEEPARPAAEEPARPAAEEPARPAAVQEPVRPVAAADAEPITEPEPPAPIGLRRPQAVPEPPAPDARASEALWIGAVEDEIRRAESSEAPLSLLLVELEDAERVIAAEHPRGASATFGRFAQSLRTALRRQDILACETDTRAWIIARETGRVGAISLADRVATAVRRAEPWRGAPMTVNVGVAVLREDGRDVDALMGAAEEAKFAAAARGVPVYGEREPPPSGGPGPGGGPHGPRLVP